MDEDSKNEDIVITDHNTIVVQAIDGDHEVHEQSIIVDDQEKDVVKEGCLSMPSMVESDLSASVCPIEPMDQSTDSLPRLAMAPVPDGSQNAVQSECDGINQAWFTTKEDKDSLQGKGVKWRQGMWSKDESELLQNNIVQYCKSRGISDPHEVIFKQSKEERKTFYRTIAKGIHRPLFAIYRRVLRTYETGNYNGKYTPEEIVKLRELKRKHGNDWTAIGLALGRSASSVKDRCRLLNEKCASGKWSQDEEDRLSQAVHELTSTVPGESVTTGILWTDVARRVGTRSEKQCRSKWLNYLNWKECGGKEWNKTDEIDLIKKIYNSGVATESEIDWTSLADGWSSARSPQWLRSKWWTIKKHVPQSLSFTDTISYLHSHYAKSLKHRLNRHDTRYLQLPNTEHPLTMSTAGATLSPLTTCATVSTSVGHAITVDGEIYIARGDGKGSDGINTYEMVHLRPLPNMDPSQPTSYIIEPVQCAVSGSATSYVLHQAPQEQGASKLVKAPACSGPVRQVMQTHGSESSQPSSSRRENEPAMMSPLAENGGTGVLNRQSDGDAGLPNHVPESFVEKAATDILQQDQQLECVSEEEISTTVQEENETSEELQNPNTAEHVDRSGEQSHDALVASSGEHTSPSEAQSLDLNFPSTDNAMYSDSLVPSLVSNTRPAQMIANEVMIPQSTLHEHILQTQGDEPAFLTDSAIVVSSPLRIVHSSLGEVTVASSVSGIPSDSLIIDNEMTYFK